jgi:nicotinate-nucleotide adenylyltransferase
LKIGLLGGSFNPPHNGHLAMARAAAKARSLDEVWLVVAARPPHKTPEQTGDSKHRMHMASLAADELPFLRACDIEFSLPGPSYTCRTLEVLSGQELGTRFFFIMGADSVPELPTWKEPGRVLELAQPVVIPRTGFSPADVEVLRGVLPESQLAALRAAYLNAEPVNISSTAIREMTHRGEPVGDMVPASVAAYIRRHGLYK